MKGKFSSASRAWEKGLMRVYTQRVGSSKLSARTNKIKGLAHKIGFLSRKLAVQGRRDAMVFMWWNEARQACA